MRLVAELERLRAELRMAQVKVLDLEAKVDTDPLLGLLNRRGFDRELKRSLAYVKRYGAPAALVFFDLDSFKPVNDRYGHAAGDSVLKAVGETLVRQVRASDVVARLGGDEFGVLLWNLSERDAAKKAEALAAAIAQAIVPWAGVALSVGATAGLAMLRPDDAPAAVLARADAAMYEQKAQRAGGLDGAGNATQPFRR